jgi:lipoprotein-anchoring transpeptidase ErfK/SrfK
MEFADMFGFRRPIAAVATAILAGYGLVAAGPAAAQSWFGGSYGDNSVYDKATVKFSTQYRPGDIIVSFGDRRLYFVTARGQATSYPIAVPRPQSRWQGTLRVSMKRENPEWRPTPRMRREDPSLPTVVAGGSKYNPLGVRALYLGSTLYRIHGTDAPWTIGKNVSKGCIRMHNEHVVELYERVRVGARVVATWKKYKPEVRSITASSGGRVDRTPGWEKRLFGLN